MVDHDVNLDDLRRFGSKETGRALERTVTMMTADMFHQLLGIDGPVGTIGTQVKIGNGQRFVVAAAVEESVLRYDLIVFRHQEVAVMPVNVPAEVLGRVARVHTAEGHALEEALDAVRLDHVLINQSVLQFNGQFGAIVRCTVREEALIFADDDA